MDIPPFRQKVHAEAIKLADAQIREGSDFQLVMTEGRKDWTAPDGSVKRYAWCGDFVTYIMMANHCETPECLNRVATRGSWAPGRNISMLIECARSVDRAYYGKDAYARAMMNVPGDILVLDVPNGGHVCFLDQVNSAESYVTCDGNTVGRKTGHRVRSFATDKIVWALDLAAFWPVSQAEWSPIGTTPPPIVFPRAPSSEGSPPDLVDQVNLPAIFSPVTDIAIGMGVLVPASILDVGDYRLRDDSFYDESEPVFGTSQTFL